MYTRSQREYKQMIQLIKDIQKEAWKIRTWSGKNYKFAPEGSKNETEKRRV